MGQSVARRSGRKNLGGFPATHLFSVFVSPAFITCFYNIAMMGHSIQQGCGHLGISKNLRPLSKTQVGCYNYRCPLIESADQVEQQCSS